jgi:hypothetical protein
MFLLLRNLIVKYFLQLTINELFTGYSFVIPAVLANRLLISVQEQVDFTDTIISDRPMQFQRGGLASTEGTFGNTIELNTIGDPRDV